MRIPSYGYDETRRIDAGVLLAIAAWLIFNSHTEAFHPYPWLAADGMLGNSLFYFISGFGIQSSLGARRQGFPEFAARRLLRIYVTLLIVVIAYHLTIMRDAKLDPQQAFATFIYPTSYTYIKVILPCYAALWVLHRTSIKLHLLSVGVALALMAGAYAEHTFIQSQPEKLVLGQLPELLWNSYFWILVASGALCAQLKIGAKLSLARMLLVGMTLAAYFGLKFLIIVENRFAALYPVLFLLVLAACILSLVTFGAPLWVRRAMQLPVLGPFLSVSSALTLEIYLVHEPLTHVAAIYSLPYPVNLAALMGLTLPLAIAVGLVSSNVQRFVDRKFLSRKKSVGDANS
ncbi:MAG: acyltransferase [Hyphomonadaceae bacterium]